MFAVFAYKDIHIYIQIYIFLKNKHVLCLVKKILFAAYKCMGDIRKNV